MVRHSGRPLRALVGPSVLSGSGGELRAETMVSPAGGQMLRLRATVGIFMQSAQPGPQDTGKAQSPFTFHYSYLSSNSISFLFQKNKRDCNYKQLRGQMSWDSLVAWAMVQTSPWGHLLLCRASCTLPALATRGWGRAHFRVEEARCVCLEWGERFFVNSQDRSPTDPKFPPKERDR